MLYAYSSSGSVSVVASASVTGHGTWAAVISQHQLTIQVVLRVWATKVRSLRNVQGDEGFNSEDRDVSDELLACCSLFALYYNQVCNSSV